MGRGWAQGGLEGGWDVLTKCRLAVPKLYPAGCPVWTDGLMDRRYLTQVHTAGLLIPGKGFPHRLSGHPSRTAGLCSHDCSHVLAGAHPRECAHIHSECRWRGVRGLPGPHPNPLGVAPCAISASPPVRCWRVKVPGHQASPAQRLVRWRSHSCAPPCARGIATVVTVLLRLWGLGPRGLSTREGQAEPASPLSTSWSQGGCAPGVQGVSPTVHLGRPCLSLTPKFFFFLPYLLLPCLPP